MKFFTTFKKGHMALILAILVFAGFVAYATSVTMDDPDDLVAHNDVVPEHEADAADTNNSQQGFVASVVNSIEDVYQDIATPEIAVEQKDDVDEPVASHDDERQPDRRNDDDTREEGEERGGSDD